MFPILSTEWGMIRPQSASARQNTHDVAPSQACFHSDLFPNEVPGASRSNIETTISDDVTVHLCKVRTRSPQGRDAL